MIKNTFISSIIFMIILSSFALAAGTSTRDSSNNNAVAIPAGTVTTCEDKQELRERIKCRIENKKVAITEKYGSVEEACRGQTDEVKNACEKLYEVSARCYNEADPILKKRCFVQVSGVNIDAKGVFRATPTETKRDYVILLLYDLQERIEKMQEEGKITTDQASSLITKIVEIKRMILAKEQRSEVVVKMNEFKKEYRLVISSKGAQE